ncbi:hypothetical protein F5876DRAFT_71066 [Lentinula aff. lateritia]|uniref:Uncharacterized protein n=1 Tax=Lentinula aff. lateritia TaxID=2804960 RepID=A0ACC1TGL8_9AGAR|nr:hypothetical protein F5876DRAFT_71066 [Lentinula aff. lateritia]
MLFHTIVSRLVVGVCLLKFVAVRAMPTNSKRVLPGKTPVSGESFEEKCKEKRWICQGYDKNDEVFATDLSTQLEEKLTLGKLSGFAPIEGNNNKGIYTLFDSVKLDSIPGSRLVVKSVDLERNSASCEVFALKALATLQHQQDKAPLFVTSGHMMHDKVKRGVIVLRKVPGTPLQDMKDWRDGSDAIKLDMISVVYNAILQQAYDLVQAQKLVHIDPDPSNILVDHSEVNLIDYGAPPLRARKYAVQSAQKICSCMKG